ncbi:sulfatase-like hydrolase/transferase [candidate division KSB1 bacterium]|nr:sulfatase-like hydrolase/transferase [candidate division KSB1 bacterium]NIR72210.1 sulfatase-like hydrolase/transferase [candidate division KSB1 bacterium]NIS26675.1 sulfatase-like hydrolase/transferase [candidate division KSB1 bacterium]NIT73443.1 sulfatase-like hydrolase/transferase [candidate division KSB1 bacterium]NIU27291.1 sulfatase-like hydrolase/transferase [candidate division KSB1 bacterium]
MNKGYAAYAFRGAVLGIIGGIIIFGSELLLTLIYAEISPGTYLFFFGLFVAFGVLGGAVLGLIVRFISGRLQSPKFQPDEFNFLSANFLFVIFFLYGFYYINEELTPGVGVFAPLSLVANAIHLLFSCVVFRMALKHSSDDSGPIRSFLTMATVPIGMLVALNFRFFLWHDPNTHTGELFLAVFGFGLVGVVGVLVSRFMNPAIEKSAGSRMAAATPAVLAVIALLVFAWSGRPSAASFQLRQPGGSTAAGWQNPKNIIWIVMDTARRDQVSIYGGDRKFTPNIDTFAEDAVVFNRAVSSAPWTIPSHASMFTGMFPSKHAAHRGVPGGRFTNPLSKENVTIAEILSSHGYETACIAANVAGLSRDFGFTQGFDYYFDGRPIAYSLFWGKVLRTVSKKFRARVLKANEICLSSEINNLVFDWLNRRSEKRPFFLFINYMEPHDGIEHIPEPYHSMFGFDEDEYEKLFRDFDQSKVVHFEQKVTPEQFEMFEIAVGRRVYFMDHHIGRLLDLLKKEGIYEDAFVIITSDHGELNGEHYSFGHNTDLYNELIWIPMIVKYPNSAKVGFRDQTVQNIDIMPELLHHLKLDIPEEVQGQPFNEVSHEIIAELFEQKKAQALLYPERYYRDLRAIYSNVAEDSLKYIWASNGKSELYDMQNDREELNNLAEQKAKVIPVLDEKLQNWHKSFTPVISTNGKLKYTKEVQERLRSLGYIK